MESPEWLAIWVGKLHGGLLFRVPAEVGRNGMELRTIVRIHEIKNCPCLMYRGYKLKELGERWIQMTTLDEVVSKDMINREDARTWL